MGGVGKKIALLIGVGEYGSGLTSLRCPENGVAAMQAILSNPEIGGFDEVVPLINPEVGEMRRQISTIFAQLDKADMVLLYFTGHGIKDMTGAFHLTTAQTELFDNGDLNTGTAVEAEFIRRVIGNSYAERKVVILDCCFGAAFAEGALGMDDGSVDVAAQLGAQVADARGWCVLTASTSTKYALEIVGEELSVYTRYLVAGLQTGGAARDGREQISIRDLHQYVRDQVRAAAPAMNPQIFNGRQGEEILIAKAVVDNEQRYRKQVQKKVQEGRGRLRPSAEANLRQLQLTFKIPAEAAAVILAEVLKPYEEKAKHVKTYTETLAAEKAYAYPLELQAIKELQELKRSLNLRDEDVRVEEEQILGSQLSDLSTIQSQPVITDLQEITQLTEPPKPVSLRYPTFSFETVRVNGQGKIVEMLPGEAEYFPEDLGNGVTLDMVRIPGGRFVMGSAEDEPERNDDESPQHEVVVPELWLGKYAVTQAQWKAVAALKKVERDLEADPAHFKGERRPVECVSWLDAVEFCARLSQRAGRVYRLASEAQWEYACRARTTTPFYFGETITSTLANYDSRETYGSEPKGEWRQTTTDVGSFPPNAFGLYDMHGNVWEWCLDGWNDSYENAPTDGSVWELSDDSKKMGRGSSWEHFPGDCRSACRGNDAPDSCLNVVGFRVSCSVPKTLV